MLGARHSCPRKKVACRRTLSSLAPTVVGQLLHGPEETLLPLLPMGNEQANDGQWQNKSTSVEAHESHLPTGSESSHTHDQESRRHTEQKKTQRTHISSTRHTGRRKTSLAFLYPLRHPDNTSFHSCCQKDPDSSGSLLIFSKFLRPIFSTFVPRITSKYSIRRFENSSNHSVLLNRLIAILTARRIKLAIAVWKKNFVKKSMIG